MLIVSLFLIEVLQKILMKDKLNVKQNRKLNIGLVILGTMSALVVTFNVTLHRGWWNGDFFSPFFTGFKNN